MLFLIEPETRRVHLCAITTNPTGGSVTQQARNLTMSCDERGRVLRHLIRDRDTKFTRSFDDVWRSIGAQVVGTPVRAPNANAFAERWVGTARRECLDHLLIVGPLISTASSPSSSNPRTGATAATTQAFRERVSGARPDRPP
ncbi:MAG: hypothetical protein M3431_10770 [Actinomycetota bacterium]|nr:hypothetical protein [Actinomycetota bacterium]